MAQHPSEAPPGASALLVRRAWWAGVAADFAVVAVATAAAFFLAAQFELSERLSRWEQRHESWQVDELPVTLLVLLSGLTWFSWRRTRQTLREIRERMLAESEVVALLTSNRDLARQLILVQENERRALARELHDEVGQNCTGIRADATYILRAHPGDNAGIMASAQRITATSEALHKLVNQMLRRLRPATLDSLGLVPALQELCENWEEQTGVSCGFFPFAVPDSLDESTCITLFRLVQESLTNVTRHAHATQVRVELRRGEGEQELMLSIEDDGCGMADGGGRQAGFGLIGMRERVAGLQGRLQISSHPGCGVRIEAMLPVTGAAA
ncbi:MAG: two-component system, NarL family, sensor histidine kinase FusK [Massilia sp.]|jgi:two-component system sensor histidine kinase UhpB